MPAALAAAVMSAQALAGCKGELKVLLCMLWGLLQPLYCVTHLQCVSNTVLSDVLHSWLPAHHLSFNPMCPDKHA